MRTVEWFVAFFVAAAVRGRAWKDGDTLEYCIRGASPVGIQLASYLESAGRSYAIFEESDGFQASSWSWVGSSSVWIEGTANAAANGPETPLSSALRFDSLSFLSDPSHRVALALEGGLLKSLPSSSDALGLSKGELIRGHDPKCARTASVTCSTMFGAVRDAVGGGVVRNSTWNLEYLMSKFAEERNLSISFDTLLRSVVDGDSVSLELESGERRGGVRCGVFVDTGFLKGSGRRTVSLREAPSSLDAYAGHRVVILGRSRTVFLLAQRLSRVAQSVTVVEGAERYFGPGKTRPKPVEPPVGKSEAERWVRNVAAEGSWGVTVVRAEVVGTQVKFGNGDVWEVDLVIDGRSELGSDVDGDGLVQKPNWLQISEESGRHFCAGCAFDWKGSERGWALERVLVRSLHRQMEEDVEGTPWPRLPLRSAGEITRAVTRRVQTAILSRGQLADVIVLHHGRDWDALLGGNALHGTSPTGESMLEEKAMIPQSTANVLGSKSLPRSLSKLKMSGWLFEDVPASDTLSRVRGWAYRAGLDLDGAVPVEHLEVTTVDRDDQTVSVIRYLAQRRLEPDASGTVVPDFLAVNSDAESGGPEPEQSIPKPGLVLGALEMELPSGPRKDVELSLARFLEEVAVVRKEAALEVGKVVLSHQDAEDAGYDPASFGTNLERSLDAAPAWAASAAQSVLSSAELVSPLFRPGHACRGVRDLQQWLRAAASVMDVTIVVDNATVLRPAQELNKGWPHIAPSFHAERPILRPWSGHHLELWGAFQNAKTWTTDRLVNLFTKLAATVDQVPIVIFDTTKASRAQVAWLRTRRDVRSSPHGFAGVPLLPPPLMVRASFGDDPLPLPPLEASVSDDGGGYNPDADAEKPPSSLLSLADAQTSDANLRAVVETLANLHFSSTDGCQRRLERAKDEGRENTPEARDAWDQRIIVESLVHPPSLVSDSLRECAWIHVAEPAPLEHVKYLLDEVQDSYMPASTTVVDGMSEGGEFVLGDDEEGEDDEDDEDNEDDEDEEEDDMSASMRKRRQMRRPGLTGQEDEEEEDDEEEDEEEEDDEDQQHPPTKYSSEDEEDEEDDEDIPLHELLDELDAAMGEL